MPQNEYAIQVKGTEPGYDWTDREEQVSHWYSVMHFANALISNQHMINRFENDKVYISTKWLLRLVAGRGLHVEHLLRVTHKGTGAMHMVAILPSNQYVSHNPVTILL
jgi:hypothetical protein